MNLMMQMKVLPRFPRRSVQTEGGDQTSRFRYRRRKVRRTPRHENPTRTQRT